MRNLFKLKNISDSVTLLQGGLKQIIKIIYGTRKLLRCTLFLVLISARPVTFTLQRFLINRFLGSGFMVLQSGTNKS
jgi:hypothetical protein